MRRYSICCWLRETCTSGREVEEVKCVSTTGLGETAHFGREKVKGPDPCKIVDRGKSERDTGEVPSRRLDNDVLSPLC